MTLFPFAQTAEEVEVTWPGGETQKFQNVAARRIYRVSRGKGLEPVRASRASAHR